MPEMTSRQRLLTAMRCQEPDRVPIIVRGVNPYAANMNWRGTADPSYHPLVTRVRESCDIQHIWSAGRGFYLNGADLPVESATETADWRITRTAIETPHGTLESVTRVGIQSYAPHGTIKHWVTAERDVDAFLSLPFSLAEPDLTDYWQAKEELGDAGYVLPYLNDPVGYVHSLLGSELLAIWSIESPHLLHRLLEAMHERCMAYTRALLEAGVSPVVGLQGQEQVVPPLLSPRQFDEFVTQYDASLVELIRSHGCLVYVHCHGFLTAALERFADMGVNVLHPIEAPPLGDITLAEAKRRVGDRICLEGNIQIGDVMTLTRREIVDQVGRAIEDAARGGGFILSLTATPFERVLSTRTRDNLFAMIETALVLGGY